MHYYGTTLSFTNNSCLFMKTLTSIWVDSVQDIDESAFNSLRKCNYPFISYQFLSALEQSGVCCHETGWQPKFLCIYQDKMLIGLLPGYIKTHSYGEYVFDWSWAHAYDQHQLPYYPKLINAIPFTPVMGPRFLSSGVLADDELAHAMAAAVKEFCSASELSSWHCLFPDQQHHAVMESIEGLLSRTDCQYHWNNRGYQSFDDFLQRMTSRKRKNIKKERKKIAEQGLSIERLCGNEICPEHLQHFYLFYHSTYLKRGRQGYLNQDFFERTLAHLREQILLVLAYRDEQPIAGSLFFYDENALYGRYWGCLEEYDSLHFECCYYQGIEYCIEQGLSKFDPGTQGEHKIARGFEPTFTRSLHYIAHPDFHDAIRRFVDQERSHIEAYAREARTLLPFNQENS